MQDETIFTQEGTLQGSVLSPLLASIALNGIENLLSNWIVEIPAFSPGSHRISKLTRRKRLPYVKYADDFVVFYPDKEIVKFVKTIIESFLKTMSLKIHEDKTDVTYIYTSSWITKDQNLNF
jgi:RNA-directed DNA polymerase